tara:strand:- start:729 stop:1331 length:603 start_codon:yes stop_codon:yes gene_type:complete
MFPLFESICVENYKIKLLEFHQKRMDHSYSKFFNKKNRWSIKNIFKSLKIQSNNKYKLRINYSETEYSISLKKYFKKKIRSLQCVELNNYSYDLKYTDRSVINKNFKFKSLCDDILIIKNGFVTDSSYCNIVFFDGLRWVTPEHPLLRGVQRNFLLTKKKIFEKKIEVSDISKYKSFVLINSMIEFNITEAVNVNKINLL